ncbi:amidohydrolase family protein [Microbulbifer sp. Q7]|uniref:amidohydrolase family protein n=1 Tax=Microbulbifer sp. Q7 TaxID=1785091 RepID=UPI00082977B4|nr:amidohydrolase family protein [Microbulbifer sp. Q7]
MHIRAQFHLVFKALVVAWLGLISVPLLTAHAFAEAYDIVIMNGRVMDPETGYDAVANVGIKDGVVTSITTKSIKGARNIDATGHVVAPGFIDLHSHGQDDFAFRLYARDGVTTPMDLEVGQYPIDQFYKYWEGKALLNYGATVSHAFARLKVLDGQNPGGRVLYEGSVTRAMDDGQQWKTKLYDPKDEPKILAAVEEGLKQGGIGIGFPIGYYTVVGSPEIMAVTGLAKKYNVPITSHVRYLSQIPPSGFMGMTEMLTIARENDVPLLLHHIPSLCLGLTKECLDLIDAARSKGQKVVGEFYPYKYAGTYVDADYNKPGFEDRLGIKASDYKVTETGKALTDKEFDRLRKEAPDTQLLMYSMKDEYIKEALTRPGVIIGSDAMPYIVDGGLNGDWDTQFGKGNGHARGAGAHARILRMVRETKAIPLMEAISKMTYGPAQFLEEHVPQMKKRGRIQEGAVADITVFDPNSVTDNAGPEIGKNSLPSTGIPYVIVNGKVVVDDSKVQRVAAGVAIRNKGQ